MIPLGSAGNLIHSVRDFSAWLHAAAVLLRRQLHADPAGAQGLGLDLELVLQGAVLVNAEGATLLWIVFPKIPCGAEAYRLKT